MVQEVFSKITLTNFYIAKVNVEDKGPVIPPVAAVARLPVDSVNVNNNIPSKNRKSAQRRKMSLPIKMTQKCFFMKDLAQSSNLT